MNRNRLTALALVLTLTAALMLSAFAETTPQAEVDAYLEKAAPLQDQIAALGTRQAEMYADAGISLEDDENVLEDSEYESYVRGLGALTEDEIKLLMDNNAKLLTLYDREEAIVIEYDGADDARRAQLDEELHSLYHEMDESYQATAEVEGKLRIAEENHYVDGLTALSDAQKAELKDMYAQQRDLEAQLSQLQETLSEAAMELLYSEG